MSVNAVNFKSSMGCSPLRNDNHVSFARKQYSEETKTENKKSHTGAYIATGIGLAAAIAAGLVFKKQVGSFFKNLKMPSFDKVKEKVVQGAEKVKDAVNNAKVKEKV